MIIYLCTKYESNTLIFSKDNERKLHFARDVQDIRIVHTDSGDTICSHIENDWCIKNAPSGAMPVS